MDTKRMLLRLVAGVTFLLAVTVTARAQSPSGSVAFESAEASTMGDSQWVGCSLTFQGKLYSCTVTGLSAPLTGVARVFGTVYGLKKLGDFSGAYKPVKGELDLGMGHLTVKNQHGVSVVLTAFLQVTELQAADGGIQIQLKEESKKAH